MEPKKEKIFAVKQGYNVIAQFNDLDVATKFFSELVKAPSKTLQSVSGKTGKCYYWSKGKEFSIALDEVEIYPSKEAAEFASSKGEGTSSDLD